MQHIKYENSGIKFDVYYRADSCRDAYGTGDSPTLHDIDITEISLEHDATDLQEVLSSNIIDLIHDEILKELA
jgi:hypothetical protein